MTDVFNLDAAKTFWSEIDTSDQTWKESALCAQTDPEAFFPERGGSSRDAKITCESCEVKAECLAWAMTHKEPYGVWGGLSEHDRRDLRAKEHKRIQRVKQHRVDRDQTIAALDASGGSIEWVAEQVGVTPRTVLRARKRLSELNQAA